MTTIFARREAERRPKATHAFVIGVGDYPHAKQGQGTNPALRQVRDLPSAADGAKLMCDWLIQNEDKLAAPLGSIEALISDVPGGQPRYLPRDARLLGKIDRADARTIPAAGKAWLQRLQGDPGSTALFYACGHGANYGMQPVLFHSDLNQGDLGSAWAHLNIGTMAQAFRQLPQLRLAFFFLDACGEYVKDFPPNVRDDGFVSPELPGAGDSDKVWLLSAASSGLLAYPGTATHLAERDPEFAASVDGRTKVKIGRFTQALSKRLDGASARWADGAWSVDNMGLWSDLRQLHRVYFPSWGDKLFEPSQFLTPNSRLPIISHSKPRLPVLVLTEPADRAAEFELRIGLADDGAEPWLDFRSRRCSEAWLTHVEGDRSRPFYALAVLDNKVCHSSFFKADQPQFDQRIPIR